MTDFSTFAQAVRAKFKQMTKQDLFIIDTDKDTLFGLYLASFPDGTNPIYLTRTEHDCNCCKQFIRNIGNVVVIDKNTHELDSVWNVKGLPHPYDIVAAEMHQYVVGQNIKSSWFTSERSYGKSSTNQLMPDGKTVKTWKHFSGDVPSKALSAAPDQLRGEKDMTAQVFRRGLEELTDEAMQTVLDLIRENSLYRGQEHLNNVKTFSLMASYYKSLSNDKAKNLFIWENINNPAARVRNTAIGTLLQDLSAGVDMETSVKSYETKVAPENYKRTTALITPAMVKAASKTIADLGLEPQLQRRLANISDVSVNNVLWVNRNSKAHMQSGLEQMLLGQTKAPATKKKATAVNEISITDFIQTVVPQAKEMELQFTGNHLGNLMTLTTRSSERSVDDVPLFKWGNDFAWSYHGNIADSSIKEKVKAAGGNVSAALRFSLAWSNCDDLDLYVTTPSGTTLYYGNRGRKFDGGQLDVDANCCGGRRIQGKEMAPVENIYFDHILDGTYKVEVRNNKRMESIDVGYTVEVEVGGQVSQYSVQSNLSKQILTVTFKNGVVTNMKVMPEVVGSALQAEAWGIKSEQFVPVTTIMRSPNFWDGNSIGNEHFFFILEGCKTDEPVRGIFNEFLRNDLTQHRKVFEVLGDKTKCQPTDEQLSGVGFSTTKPQSVVVRVTTDQGKKEYTVLV